MTTMHATQLIPHAGILPGGHVLTDTQAQGTPQELPSGLSLSDSNGPQMTIWAPGGSQDIPPGLDTAAIIAIVEAKYSDLTKDIQALVKQQQGQQALSARLGQDKAVLTKYETTQHLEPGTADWRDATNAIKDAAQIASTDAKLQGYAGSVAGQEQVLKTQQGQGHTITANGQTIVDPTKVDAVAAFGAAGEGFTQDDVKSAMAAIDADMNAMNSDAQMQMISLQDKVSKVQTLLTMTTNLLQTIHDMQKSIVNNIHA
jgi:hypothetical protein